MVLQTFPLSAVRHKITFAATGVPPGLTQRQVDTNDDPDNVREV